MFKHIKRLAALSLLIMVPTLSPATAAGLSAQASVPDTSLLEGDERYACEAILCLAASSPPQECDPALSRFFSIKKLKLSDTLDARESFLNLCPAANSTPQMSSLVKAMARGAGRCDAKTLNQTLAQSVGPGGDAGTDGMVISDLMPSYCSAYIMHEYVRIADDLPRYVGKPSEDGFWADAKNYAAALARYEREQAAKKAARENYGSGGN